MKKTFFILFLFTFLISSQFLLAHWNVGDLHKMGGNGPQLPDETGYDVCLTNNTLADDWQCGETGPVDLIHFWISWKGLMDPGSLNLFNIIGMNIEIYSDDPVGDDPGIPNYPGDPNGEDPDNTYSKPLNHLWESSGTGFSWVEVTWSSDIQGWYDPYYNLDLSEPIYPIVYESDHNNCEQVNVIIPTLEAFEQIVGTTYWLVLTSVSIDTPNMNGDADSVGWKTSQNHWNDDAVFLDFMINDWSPLLPHPLGDPASLPGYEEHIDLAFVISGSDATLPVELSAFTAVYNNKAAHLSWMTQTEVDNLGWNVYRSTQNEFSTAAKVNNGIIDGYGTTSEPSYYNFVDDSPNLTIGTTYYYWLESIDLGGENHIYNSVVTVTIPDPQHLPQHPSLPVVYNLNAVPNPMLDHAEFEFTLDKDAVVDIAIYNLRGQLVKELPSVATKEDEANSIYWNGKDSNEQELAPGIYLYKLKANGKTVQTEKLILMD